MRRLVKYFLHYFCYFVERLALTVKFFVSLLMKGDFKNYVKKNGGADILTILANGPSLKDNLEKIDSSNGDFSVVNDFYKSPYYKIIKPKYHVLADPLYFRNDDDIQPFVDAVDWNMKLFVPYSAWRDVDLLRNMHNKNIEVIPYNSGEYQGFESLRYWIYKKGFAMPKVQNVLVASIFTGINMGYKEIRLYGVDHSWTESIKVDEMNRVCQIDSHFYDTQEVKLTPWHKCNGEQYLMHEILRDLANMFDSYHQIRKYAEEMGCRVLNCTRNSYIDAFERA